MLKNLLTTYDCKSVGTPTEYEGLRKGVRGNFLETQMGFDRLATESYPVLRLRKARNCPSWGNFLS